MSKIRILPDHLANQIAAGEVVERPASVVKELVENSLDAGASHIEIEIEGGGTRLIRIIDDGEGMDEDDVLLCLERHGTSKIKDGADLVAVRTLGFRGEAIPSISSVSRMVITSRRKENELGTTLICHYGSIKKVHEAGTQAGTSFEISNLFGNTPARRKFLRTRRTEVAHIDDTVRNYCLARPDVAFTLRIDGRQVIRFDSETSIQQRLSTLMNYSGDFITVNTSLPAEGIRISGLLASPESSTPVAARLRVFVNGRAIRDRMIVHAVNEGMRSFLLKGKSPAGMIKIDVPPESIDVNVHPAKHEIRFRDSRVVHTKVGEAVRNAMLDHQQRVRSEIFSTRTGHERLGIDNDYAQPPTTINPHVPASRPQPTSLLEAREQNGQYSAQIPAIPEAAPVEVQPTAADFHSPLPSADNSTGDPPLTIEDLMVIGSFRDLYIFCRNKDKLIVIDQHAAHERILFEHLQDQYTRGKIASQHLLFPVTLELSVFQSQLVEKNLEQLESMGFSVREFGGSTWILAAVPALAGGSNPQDLFLDMLEQFGSEKDTGGGSTFIDILATKACKAAVKSGDQLSNPEIKALLEKMIRADLFSHCPHGRPVVKILDAADIKKWFYRT